MNHFVIYLFLHFPLPPQAASALLCVLAVRAVRVRGVFAARLSSNMKRGKKSEEAAAAAENDPDSGTK